MDDVAEKVAAETVRAWPDLAAGTTEQVEFHCMLVRRDVFVRLGPLDESLRSVREHLDLCLRVQEDGGEVWFDPEVTATYASVDRMSISDRAYWLERFSLEEIRELAACSGSAVASSRLAGLVRGGSRCDGQGGLAACLGVDALELPP